MKKVKLGEFVNIRQGLAINKASSHLVSKKQNETFIYPLLKIADMIENKFSKFISSNVNKNVIATNDDIIYTRTGKVGLVFRKFQGVVHNNSFIVSLKNNNMNKNYLYYILQSSFVKKQAIELSKTSVQPDLAHSKFKSIKIPFIDDINTQEKIANILSNIDDKIENNNKISAKLEQMAKLIYDYYFVQFDYPDENGKPYKSSGGAMKYNEILKREIPINWEVQSIAKNNLTKTIKPGVSFFEHKIYLATANVINSNITDGNIITYENRESRANMQPTLNSVWFAKMKNSIKHIFVPKNAKWFIDKYILSTGFYGLQCEENSFSYIYSVIKSDFFEKRKNILAHGATQEAVNQTDLQLLYFLIPENEVLKKYNNLIYNSLEQINNILKENQKLSSLRDFLLPMLMNGQVSFKN